MLRTWVIAGIALAASTGPIFGQDAAAGEQVFKRLCSPCHEIGQDAKIKLGPPLNAIDGRKSGTFEGFNYSPANKSSGISFVELPMLPCTIIANCRIGRPCRQLTVSLERLVGAPLGDARRAVRCR